MGETGPRHCFLNLAAGGTIMMSGRGILTNGKGTRREYGDFNLDELVVGATKLDYSALLLLRCRLL
jgi:hypothetical protein